MSLGDQITNAINQSDPACSETQRQDAMFNAFLSAIVSFVEADQTRSEQWRNDTIEEMAKVAFTAASNCYDFAEKIAEMWGED